MTSFRVQWLDHTCSRWISTHTPHILWSLAPAVGTHAVTWISFDVETNRISVSVLAPTTAIWTVSASFILGQILIYDFRWRFSFSRKSCAVSGSAKSSHVLTLYARTSEWLCKWWKLNNTSLNDPQFDKVYNNTAVTEMSSVMTPVSRSKQSLQPIRRSGWATLRCPAKTTARLFITFEQQVYADWHSNLVGENAEKLLFLAYNIRLFQSNYWQKIDVSVSRYDLLLTLRVWTLL